MLSTLEFDGFFEGFPLKLFYSILSRQEKLGILNPSFMEGKRESDDHYLLVVSTNAHFF